MSQNDIHGKIITLSNKNKIEWHRFPSLLSGQPTKMRNLINFYDIGNSRQKEAESGIVGRS